MGMGQDEQLVHELASSVANGHVQEAIAIAETLLRIGCDVQKIVENGLTKALESLDAKCNNDQFNLLEILLAGRAVMEVMEQVVCPYLDKEGERCWEVYQEGKEVIVLGTIMGDIHDLGKNIVAILLKMAGYRVVDLGKDVPPNIFAEEAKKHQARFVGVSSLITSTMHHIKNIRPCLEEIGLSQVKILAGGAAARQADCQELNVDFVADNVFELLDYLRMTAGEGAQ